MNRKANIQTISARIREDVVKQLNEVAKETERTMSFHIEKALIFYLNEYADLQIALDRLNNPNDRIVSFEEMEDKVEIPDKV